MVVFTSSGPGFRIADIRDPMETECTVRFGRGADGSSNHADRLKGAEAAVPSSPTPTDLTKLTFDHADNLLCRPF